MAKVQLLERPNCIRPIHVMCEDGVSQAHVAIVLESIDLMLRLGGVSKRIEVKNFGVWRNPGYRTGNALAEWKSVDWYLQDSKADPTRRINAGRLLHRFQEEPWQRGARHYDICVLRSDMFAPPAAFVVGLASPYVGTVVSVNRFLGLTQPLQNECIKTLTMHELGHVFGLIPRDRTANVEMSLGRHCTNRCTMRQGLRVPNDWVRITEDRLKYGPFCQVCYSDLQRFFH